MYTNRVNIIQFLAGDPNDQLQNPPAANAAFSQANARWHALPATFHAWLSCSGGWEVQLVPSPKYFVSLQNKTLRFSFIASRCFPLTPLQNNKHQLTTDSFQARQLLSSPVNSMF